MAYSERNAVVWTSSVLYAAGALIALTALQAAVSVHQELAVRSAPKIDVRSSPRLPQTSLRNSQPLLASQATVPQRHEVRVITQGAVGGNWPQTLFSGLIGFAGGLSAALYLAAARRSSPSPVDVITPTLAMASTSGGEETTYHFVVANSKFMLYDEEHAMEVLREKRRFLNEKKLPLDFWIVPSPEFLDKLPDIDKRVAKPCCALVSTDEVWIRFMKLRYDRVIMGSFKGSSDIKVALATKGGDPVAAVPPFKLPENWPKDVPYPKYTEDWYLPFLVTSQ